MAIETKSEPTEATLSAASTPKIDSGERSKALKAISDHRKATAWQVHRWPVDKRVIEHRTKIHLPRSYLMGEGEDVKTVWEGADLNQIVHQHYIQTVSGETLPAHNSNFVTPDSIAVKRHEYLGPDPRIAGYQFDLNGEVHVKWWDGFLQDLWMDKGKWRFDIKMTEDGKWVEIDD